MDKECMDILILKTNINSIEEFLIVKRNLKKSFYINDCTIDLDDVDKVLRITGDQINYNKMVCLVNNLGFVCEELSD